MKVCSKCGIEKDLNTFHKNKALKDGYNNWCKECRSLHSKTDLNLMKYRRDYFIKNKKEILSKQKDYYEENKEEILKKEYFRHKIYRTIKKPWFVSFDKATQRCNNPKQTGYKDYGGKGIKQLMTLDDFEFLWFRDKAVEMERPSIDRIDSNGNYELSNCRFLELGENTARKNNKKILQFDLHGDFIKEWESIKEAELRTSICRTSISLCCRNLYKKAGNYIWKYKEA